MRRRGYYDLPSRATLGARLSVRTSFEEVTIGHLSFSYALPVGSFALLVIHMAQLDRILALLFKYY
jgi:hypothetical protein